MKILTAVVAGMAILALALILLFHSPDNQVADTGSGPLGATPEGLDSASSKIAEGEPLRQRVDAPAVLEDVSRESQAPVVTPFEVRILAVDTDGEKVPWATVEVWPAHRVRMGAARGAGSAQTGSDAAAGEWVYRGRHPGLEPLQKLSTDASGRCSFEADREFCFLSVHKEGVGRSDDISLSPLVNKGEHRVVLRQVSVITGVVMQSTGIPKGDMQVRAILIGGPSGERVPSQLSARTDVQGRFRFQLSARATYVLIAGDKSLRSDKVQIPPIPGGGERKVLLQLPGAYSIRGRVLDPGGDPVHKGSVVAWLSGLRQSTLRSTPIQEGQFDLPLTSAGNYVVRAQCDGFAWSRVQGIALDGAVPSVHVTLRVLPLSNISGRVLGPDERPLAAVSLKAWRQVPGQQRIEAREPLMATTASDGTFVIEGSHPAAQYTLVVTPDTTRPRLALRKPGLAGDAKGLEFRLDGALLNGSKVTGRFIDGKSRRPVKEFELQVLHHRNGAISSLPPRAVSSGTGEFTIDGLKVGETYSLKATAEGQLVTLSKTFDAVAGENPVQLVSPVPCRVVCKIKRSDGRSIEGLTVRFVPAGSLRIVLPAVSGRTDHTGSAEIQTAPGKYKLFVFPGGTGKKVLRSVEVHSGIVNTFDVSI